MKLLSWLLDLRFPPKCVFCRKLLDERETDLCTKCKIELPRINGSIKRGSTYRRCWPVYFYDGTVRRSIQRFKFDSKEYYASAYGRQLAMLLLRQRVKFDVLTWVPVSRRRLNQRGYDQARLLAEATAKALGVECIRTLKKIVNNKPQSHQPTAEARRGNVKGVYAPYRPERFIGKQILLIDDVITTGATLTECSDILKIAGAAGIEAAVLAAAEESK